MSLSLSLCLSLFPAMQHWRELCHTVRTARWNKIDTRDGVTVARCKFGRSSRGHAVIKVEGILPADPSTVYQFLKLSTREGGKVSVSRNFSTDLQFSRKLYTRSVGHSSHKRLKLN